MIFYSLNMYGPILYSNDLNTYTDKCDISDTNKFVVHKLTPCNNIVIKKKKSNINIEPLVNKFIYIKLNIVYDKWIKLNYNYIHYNNNIYLINYIDHVSISTIPDSSENVNIFETIVYLIRYLIILVLYNIKLQINKYVRVPEVLLLEREIYELSFNKTTLDKVCSAHNISLRYLVLSIYIYVIGNIRDEGLIVSHVNDRSILHNDIFNINSDNREIYFLPIKYDINKIYKYVKILEKEYAKSYKILGDIPQNLMGVFDNVKILYGYDYIDNIDNIDNKENIDIDNINMDNKENRCDLKVINKDNNIILIFNHILRKSEILKIVENFKKLISIISI